MKNDYTTALVIERFARNQDSQTLTHGSDRTFQVRECLAADNLSRIPVIDAQDKSSASFAVSLFWGIRRAKKQWAIEHFSIFRVWIAGGWILTERLLKFTNKIR